MTDGFLEEAATHNQAPTDGPGIVVDGNADDFVAGDDQGAINQQDQQGQQDQPLNEQPGRKFAGKYETPEELERAYTESNKEATRMAQRLSQMENHIRQNVSQANQQANQVDPKQVNQQFLLDFANDPVSTMQKFIQQAVQPIQQTVTQSNYSRTIEHMEANPDKFPGFTEVRGNMADILEQNPWVYNSQNPMLTAYNMAVGQNMDKLIQDAVAKAKQIQSDNNQQLQRSNVTGGSVNKGKSPGQSQKSEADIVLEGILGVRDPVADFINS